MNSTDVFSGMFGDSDSMMLALLVFLAAATLAFCTMAAVQIRGSVRRRAASLSPTIEYGDRPRALRHSSFKLAQNLIEYATRHYASSDEGDMKVLRGRMIKAGIFDPRAVGYFFFARTTFAIGLATAVFFFAPALQNNAAIWFMVIVGGIIGYVGPSIYIDRRIKSRRLEHQAGFPDFMDLLVVCADAGLSMEASLDRVGRELGDSYPSLTANIHMANLEIRAGRTMSDALDIIVRSLRAGHPVPIAITMVARESPDPVGTEFGIVADEITYGADLETAMRNLYFRIGQDDLPLFVTAVAIQGSTGGNLGEILENLSAVIRQRFKMRRKIRALAAEGRASALILSSLPIVMFAIVQLVAPDFYGSVWHESITKMILATAGSWMAVGNFVMYRMVNFRI